PRFAHGSPAQFRLGGVVWRARGGHGHPSDGESRYGGRFQGSSRHTIVVRFVRKITRAGWLGVHYGQRRREPCSAPSTAAVSSALPRDHAIRCRRPSATDSDASATKIAGRPVPTIALPGTRLRRTSSVN